MRLVFFIMAPILFGVIMEVRTHFEGAGPRAIVAAVAGAVLAVGMHIGAQWRKTRKEVSQGKTADGQGESKGEK
jgi:predicted aconitase